MIPNGDKFIPFRPLFDTHILLASSRLESSTITFFWAFIRLYPLAVFYITSIHHHVQLYKNAKHCPFQILIFSIVSGMPLSSKHSRLEYQLLLHVCRSKLATFSLSLVFTSLVIDKSNLAARNLFLKSHIAISLYDYNDIHKGNEILNFEPKKPSNFYLQLLQNSWIHITVL